MAVEIERKFLVADWPQPSETRTSITQAYLATGPVSVRVRIRTRDGQRDALLAVKGPASGLERPEFEYPIPVADADAIAQLAVGTIIEKDRYTLSAGAHIWEVDVFGGANAPLIVAEVELTRASEPFERPAWVGEEVTDDRRYLNAHLAERPFSTW